ncbi:FimV/HubP family polar landmark protein [Alloalcanivorax xenomutans]|jgi:pilus assembly protein FimV|uniref:FimV/HubP family polar landmark protein n=1 Tax=Alloalcanivorax xenomutans TaxID=1094342 RepID=UPI001F35E679|nr:FimV/HubP family polar landmark protein [Alloalcanivorax xenomutans]MCE7521766.1 peptigoglycan-binding protein LysM [Alloalcanivorax xenomutans]
MLRKFGIGFVALAAMTPGLAAALGVGEYELNSYLNQPLEMDVVLHETGRLSTEEIVVNLAPQAEFDSAGVERGYFLNDLTFEVTFTGEGDGVLHIRSRQPVREPYLNFLVEILWPTGRLVREYTVLLDPPSYDAGGEAVSAAQVQPAPVPVVPQAQPKTEPAPPAPEPELRAPAVSDAATEGEPREEPQEETANTVEPEDDAGTVAESAEPKPEPEQADSDQGGTASSATPGRGTLNENNDRYRVRSSDTLWRIAAEHRPGGGVSVQQMMMAIQEMNPEAFIDGNINLVREGAVLRLPSERQAAAIASSEAMRRVADQTSEWRQRRAASTNAEETLAAAQLDATEQSDAAPVEQEGDGGRVTLVAPDASDAARDGDGTGTGGGGEAATAALQNELAIRDENLDRLSRENDELRSRIDELGEQLDTSGEMLRLQNEKIAALQEALRQLREGEGDGKVDEALLAPARITPAEMAPEQQAPGEPVPAETTDPAAGTSPPADSAAMGGAATDSSTTDTERPDGAAKAAPKSPSQPASGADSAASVRPLPPAAEPAAPAPAGWLDWVMRNLLYLGAAVAALLLLLLLALRRRQSGKDDPEEDALPPLMPLADDGDNEDEGRSGQDPVAARTGAGGADDEDGSRAAAAASQDPLEEVEVYVAYGRYPQAADFLRNEINQAPGRNDLKVRLLEVLNEMGDQAAFRQQAALYAGTAEELDRAIERLGGGGQAGTDESAPLSLDDLELDLAGDPGGPVPSEHDQQGETGEDPLNLDDFEFSLDDDKAPPSEADDDEPVLIDDDPEEALALDEEPLTHATLTVRDDTPVSSDGLDLDDLDFSSDFSSDTGDTDDIDGLELDSTPVEAPREEPVTGTTPPGSESLEFQLDDLELEWEGDKAEPAAEPVSEPESDDHGEEGTEDQGDDTFEFSLDGLDLDDAGADETPEAAIELPEPVAADAGTEAFGDPAFDAPAPAEPPASEVQEPAAPVPVSADEDDEFDFLAETDENATKLDLARAYIEMGDMEGARDILNEVISEGSDSQRDDARQLLERVE